MMNIQKYNRSNSSNGLLHEKWLCIFCSIFIYPLQSYAAAGFSDRFNDYHNWIYPAYKYYFILWLLCFIILITLSLPFKKPLKCLLSKIADYLQSKEALSILIVGTFIAIPIGLLSSGIMFLLEEYLWIVAIIPSGGILATIPFILDSKNRNNIFHRIPILWISFILTISATLAIASFIILTNNNILFEESEKVYHTFRNHCEHPYGSLISILSMPIYGIFIVIVYLIIYWLSRFRSRNTSHH